MKNNLSLLAVSVLFLTACHKEENPPANRLEANKSEIILPGHPDAIDSITITANVAWTLTMDRPVDWLHLDTSKGSGTTTVHFRNTRDNNSTSEELTLTLSAVGNGVQSSTIKVSRIPYFRKQFSRLLGEDFRGNFTGGIATPDGGVIMVGGAGRTLPGSTYFQTDGLITRFNSAGELVWKKVLGGTLDDYLFNIVATTDGQYMIAGSSKSSNGDIENGNKGEQDFWVVKINGQGQVTWSRTFGGTQTDIAQGIAAMDNGRCIVTGWSLSDDGLVGTQTNNGAYKTWTMTVNADGSFGQGNVITNNGKSLMPVNLIPSGDGNYVIIGNKARQPGLSNELWDSWLARISPAGNILWQQTYDGYVKNEIRSAIVTKDGGYLLAGNCYEEQEGDADIRLVKTDANGNKVWEKKFGGNGDDEGSFLTMTADGNYLLAALTSSNDGSVPDFHGHADGWVLKLDTKGNRLWARAIGGSGLDYLYTIVRTSNNNYVVGGYSYSNDGDVSGNRGSSDAWLFKFE